MKKLMMTACACAALVALAGCKGERTDDGTKVCERVELVSYRTELRHVGCGHKGFWRSCGAPKGIESYAINKFMWPHKCSGCGATNEIYDARWPKIDQVWRAVK